MSTTFAVMIPKENESDEEVEVAFRSNSNVRWLNPLAELLPDETHVIAIDNSQQGIYTIGDIKKHQKNS